MAVCDFDNGTLGTPWINPDWRWQRAVKIVVEADYATRLRDGVLVQRAARYLRAVNRALTDRGVRSAAKKWPDVFLALKVANEATLRPLEIKARVLAGESNPVIARKVGLPLSTVTTYADLFLDLRDALTATCWIKWEVIGLRHDQPPSVESLMLLQAWRRGSNVIGPWLDYLKHQEERHDLGTDLGRQRAWFAHLIRVHQLPFEAQCLRSLWRLSPFFLGKPSDVIRSTTVAAVVLKNRDRLLAEIAWNEPSEPVIAKSNISGWDEEPHKNYEEGKLAQVG